jgi:hypothetical protein
VISLTILNKGERVEIVCPFIYTLRILFFGISLFDIRIQIDQHPDIYKNKKPSST